MKKKKKNTRINIKIDSTWNVQSHYSNREPSRGVYKQDDASRVLIAMALRNRTAAKKQSRTHSTASGGVLVFRATITTNAARGDAKDERSYGSYLRSVSNTREPTAEESAERFLRKKKKNCNAPWAVSGRGGDKSLPHDPGS